MKVLLDCRIHIVQFKYAYYSNSLVHKNTDIPLSDEFSRIQLWTECNGLIINFDKTKSLYFIVLTLASTVFPRQLRVLNVCMLLNCLE